MDIKQSHNRAYVWYDKYTRSWVVQEKDALGNQIGDAQYFGSKREAEAERAVIKGRAR